jgi:predicted alpha/beta-fold hydrolase
VQVLVTTQHAASPRGQMVMVHGLEGSGESGYMVSLSKKANAAGFTAHRFHMRTCGGTGHLCKTLYHAGLTSDLLSVLRTLRDEGNPPAFLIGFSLGGNVALKLAAELGDSAHEWIAGVCTLSTPLDLEACANRIADPDNRVYQRRFVQRMRRRLLATGRYAESDFATLRTVREIDDHITAPSFGFGTAVNYYRTQSAIGYLDRIRVPVRLIQSKDDTFIPYRVYESEAVQRNSRIDLVATDHGGHLGFLARGRERFWADVAVMEWVERQAGLGAALGS